MEIQPLDSRWREPVSRYVREEWAGPMLVTRGRCYDSSGLPGFVSLEGDRLLGAALYRPDGQAWEVACLFSLEEGKGVGRALLDAVAAGAGEAGCNRIWLVTTNDNTRAIRFYQRYGFSLAAVHIGALARSRLQKPSLPLRGIDGIPLEHEFEFVLEL